MIRQNQIESEHWVTRLFLHEIAVDEMTADSISLAARRGDSRFIDIIRDIDMCLVITNMAHSSPWMMSLWDEESPNRANLFEDRHVNA